MFICVRDNAVYQHAIRRAAAAAAAAGPAGPLCCWPGAAARLQPRFFIVMPFVLLIVICLRRGARRARIRTGGQPRRRCGRPRRRRARGSGCARCFEAGQVHVGAVQQSVVLGLKGGGGGEGAREPIHPLRARRRFERVAAAVHHNVLDRELAERVVGATGHRVRAAGGDTGRERLCRRGAGGQERGGGATQSHPAKAVAPSNSPHPRTRQSG